MDLRLTRHQVPRAARADAESGNKMYLIKNVRVLRLTYQIRLLTFRAIDSQMKLILTIPRNCKLNERLAAFVKDHAPSIAIERFNT